MNYFYLNPIKENILYIDNASHRKIVIDNIIKLRKGSVAEQTASRKRNSVAT